MTNEKKKMILILGSISIVLLTLAVIIIALNPLKNTSIKNSGMDLNSKTKSSDPGISSEINESSEENIMSSSSDFSSIFNSGLSSKSVLSSKTISSSLLTSGNSPTSNPDAIIDRRPGPPPVGAVSVSMLMDTKFAKGFGAAWVYGLTFSDNTQLKKGNVLTYRDISPYQINLIPFGNVNDYSENDIYWEFEEGNHKNFTDKYGKWVTELFEHKLCVNASVKENTSSSLIVEQFNNYGLDSNDPKYNKSLVKRITTNKNGTIGFYFNSKNDIRNAAYAYGAEFANDIWPHLYFHQNFRKDYDVALFSRIDVNFNVLIKKVNQIDTWPDNDTSITAPKSKSEASLQGFFFCRLKTSRTQGFFVGMNIYSSREENQQLTVSADQYGQAFYRTTPLEFGGKVALGKTASISYDLKEMIVDALEQIKKRPGPLRTTKADDYEISFLQIGWENMGNWECEYELSNLSTVGYKK